MPDARHAPCAEPGEAPRAARPPREHGPGVRAAARVMALGAPPPLITRSADTAAREPAGSAVLREQHPAEARALCARALQLPTPRERVRHAPSVRRRTRAALCGPSPVRALQDA